MAELIGTCVSCSGVNGSHTQICPRNVGETIRCWDCGRDVPADYAMAWSVLGSRCLQHEGTRAEEIEAATRSQCCQVCGLPIAIGDMPCVIRIRAHGPLLKTPLFVPYYDVGLGRQIDSFADRWTAMRQQGLVDRDLPRPGDISARRDRAHARRKEEARG